MFTQSTFDFLADLEANNSKDWFDANRDRYEAHWRSPALGFIDQVSDAMGRLEPPLKAEARLNGSLRRINRDVRFSKDKSPYNARLHLIFWAGAHPNKSPGFHLVLTPDGVGYGAGTWALDKTMLDRYRARILDDADRALFEGALGMAQEVGCRLSTPELARVPSGYEGEGRMAELLRYKTLVARTHDTHPGPEFLTEPGAEDRVIALAEQLSPFNAWIGGLNDS